MKVTSSAPGKLMLFGEHAVLHGYPCLVTSVDLRYTVSIELVEEPVITIQTPVLEDKKEESSLKIEDLYKYPLENEDTNFVMAVLQELFPYSDYKNGLRIYTDGPLISYGLGSSSAICSATTQALSALFSMNLSLEEIFQRAFAAVLKVQKTGSGFDAAAATFGGTIRYKIGNPIEKVPVDNIPLVIGFTGNKVGTVEIIQKVTHSEKKYPGLHETIYQSIGAITESAQTAVLNRDWENLGKLADKNQELLENLGVSTPNLNKGIKAARQACAYGAKLSGAGGGDCLFAICNEDQLEMVEDALEKAGIQVLHYRTNCEGVRLE
jgi:mevalonate kinase